MSVLGPIMVELASRAPEDWTDDDLRAASLWLAGATPEDLLLLTHEVHRRARRPRRSSSQTLQAQIEEETTRPDTPSGIRRETEE